MLYHYAFRVCGDRAAAEDVVSAAFLEAWRCRGKVHADGGSLRPWLLGIATNIMRGAAREAGGGTRPSPGSPSAASCRTSPTTSSPG